MEWKKSEIIELISLYKRFGCLWDYKSPMYKRIDLKKNAWQKIAKRFAKDVEEVKKKIKYLRTAYVAEKRRIARSKKANGSISETHLFYFTDMEFLDSVIVSRSILEAQSGDLQMKDEETVSGFNGVLLSNASTSQSTPLQMPSSPSSTITSTAISSHQHNQVINKDEKYKQQFDGTVAIAPTIDTDIYASFSKTIALHLQQLSPIEAIKTMSEIHQLVTRKVIKSMLNSQNKTSELSDPVSEQDVLGNNFEEEYVEHAEYV